MPQGIAAQHWRLGWVKPAWSFFKMNEQTRQSDFLTALDRHVAEHRHATAKFRECTAKLEQFEKLEAPTREDEQRLIADLRRIRQRYASHADQLAARFNSAATQFTKGDSDG